MYTYRSPVQAACIMYPAAPRLPPRPRHRGRAAAVRGRRGGRTPAGAGRRQPHAARRVQGGLLGRGHPHLAARPLREPDQ